VAAAQVIVPSLGEHEPVILRAGIDLAPDLLGERLVELGYMRSDVVERRGEFAIRGGIVDLFPGTASRPVRMEFLGDEIESLREFIPATQLSSGRVEVAQVHPVRELVLNGDLRSRAGKMAPKFTGRIGD